jgi:hypothetical protein
MNRLFHFVVLLLLAPALYAAPITIDFEEQTVGVDGLFALDAPEIGVVDGFRFYRPDGQVQGGWIDPATIPMTGNDSLVALDWCDLTCGGTGTVAMEVAGGGWFDLVGLDFSTYSGGVLDVIGYLTTGGTLTETLNVAIGKDWNTTVLNWNNLSRVEFIVSVEAFQIGFIDNIVVTNVVPIPAALPLLGSALLLLGWRRRVVMS